MQCARVKIIQVALSQKRDKTVVGLSLLPCLCSHLPLPQRKAPAEQNQKLSAMFVEKCPTPIFLYKESSLIQDQLENVREFTLQMLSAIIVQGFFIVNCNSQSYSITLSLIS